MVCFLTDAVCILLAAAVQKMMPSPPPTAVGIDLGTTFSCIAVFEDGDITVINNHKKRSITASVLFAPDDGSSFTVGEDARSTAASQPGTLVYLPGQWAHATLNLEEGVGVGGFLQDEGGLGLHMQMIHAPRGMGSLQNAAVLHEGWYRQVSRAFPAVAM